MPDFSWTIQHDACVGFRQTYIKFSSTAHELRLWPLPLSIALALSFSRVWLFCDPMDCSPPGSSVHGILQAKILEWVAISFSRGSSWPRDQTLIFCIHRQILYHWATWEAPYLSISVSKWDYHTSEHCYDSIWGAVDKGPVVAGFQVRSFAQLTGETWEHSEWELLGKRELAQPSVLSTVYISCDLEFLLCTPLEYLDPHQVCLENIT